MYSKSQTIAYSLAIFVLMNALFVLDNTNRIVRRESRFAVSHYKQQIQKQFLKAFIQTIGDRPFITDELALIFDSVNNFYVNAANETLALMDPKDADDDVIEVGREVYLSFAQVVYNSNLRTGDESTNHQPQTLSGSGTGPTVAGISTQIDWNYDPVKMVEYGKFMSEDPVVNIIPEETKPANLENQWVTLQDNFTGQMFCVAIYNTEINKYLGKCR